VTDTLCPFLVFSFLSNISLITSSSILYYYFSSKTLSDSLFLSKKPCLSTLELYLVYPFSSLLSSLVTVPDTANGKASLSDKVLTVGVICFSG
jgi:hypothetical protein